MITRPANWDLLWESEGTLCTYKIIVDGVDLYTGIDDIERDTLKIYKTLFTSDKLIGNTPCFSMDCCLRLNDREIPRGAMLEVYVALRNKEVLTDYIPLGTFKVYRRKNYPDGWVQLNCRDKMQMANQAYFPNVVIEGEWPKSMRAVLEETTTRLGITIDPRTQINEGVDWMVNPPTTKSIRQVWSYIAAAHGGNIFITPENTLLLACPKADGIDPVDTICSASGFENLGDPVYVDRVTLVIDSETEVFSGESGLNNIVVDCPYASQVVVDYVKSQLTGVLYHPLTIQEMVFNPAAEIQDSFKVNGLLTTWSTLDLSCEIVPLFNGEAESVVEPDSEYGFEDTPTNQVELEVRQYAESVVDRQTQTDIFNKLTNNGQAQGLFLSANGQLYVNASYLSTGVLASKDGTTFYLDLDEGILDMKARSLSIQGQSVSDFVLDGLSQQDIVDKLTANGAAEGIYLKDGQLYINANYIISGVLNASLITAGTLQSKDGKTFVLDLDKGTLQIEGSGKITSADGNSYIVLEGNEFVLYAKEGEYGDFVPISQIGFTEDSEGYDYPYFQLGHVDTASSNSDKMGLMKMFKNGMYLGNAVPKNSTGSFLGLPGAAGFFIDTIKGVAYTVDGADLTDVSTAKFA